MNCGVQQHPPQFIEVLYNKCDEMQLKYHHTRSVRMTQGMSQRLVQSWDRFRGADRFCHCRTIALLVGLLWGGAIAPVVALISPSLAPRIQGTPADSPTEAEAAETGDAEALPAPMDLVDPEATQRSDRRCFTGVIVASEKDIRQMGLTPPSLWLSRELMGGKVVHGWRVYLPVVGLLERPWVDVVVNLQPWQNLDYLEQYALLQEFGNTANEYGFNLRLCAEPERLLGLQSCPTPPTAGLDGDQCHTRLEGGFRASRQRL